MEIEDRIKRAIAALAYAIKATKNPHFEFRMVAEKTALEWAIGIQNTCSESFGALVDAANDARLKATAHERN